IWAYGLRNPWRFSFDRATGTLWAGDVGQNAIEEIDIIVKGGNYGWRVYEGNRENINPNNIPASEFIAPVYTYSHELGQSITGGNVYRGAAIPGLRGDYIYGDFVSGKVWALDYKNGEVYGNTLIAEMTLVSSFGEDAEGELYITSFDGNIYKMVAE
ncbi:MAG TPA: PQQ-dependent sugar dehydrogenase, partial [Gammaproteobacteria bacterium]|nr:PQQ-dependent sugar dehydrogenase [Gammaproteobacteria bacterium]